MGSGTPSGGAFAGMPRGYHGGVLCGATEAASDSTATSSGAAHVGDDASAATSSGAAHVGDDASASSATAGHTARDIIYPGVCGSTLYAVRLFVSHLMASCVRDESLRLRVLVMAIVFMWRVAFFSF